MHERLREGESRVDLPSRNLASTVIFSSCATTLSALKKFTETAVSITRPSYSTLLQHIRVVAQLPRQPGTKEARYAHLLMGPIDEEEFAAGAQAPVKRSGLEQRVTELEDKIAQLEAQFEQFKSQF